MISCVYRIVHVATGREYIGSTQDFNRRRGMHLSHLRRGIHHSPKLQRSWSKRHPSEFAFEILERVDDTASLFAVEQRYMSERRPYYNVCAVAGSCRGVRRSAETIEKLRKSSTNPSPCVRTRMRIGQFRRGPLPKEQRARMVAARVGKKRSPEAVAKTAAANRGRKMGDAQRALISRLRTKHAVVGTRISDGATLLYRSMRATGAGDFHPSAVRRCIIGRQRAHKGFTWASETLTEVPA